MPMMNDGITDFKIPQKQKSKYLETETFFFLQIKKNH